MVRSRCTQPSGPDSLGRSPEPPPPGDKNNQGQGDNNHPIYPKAVGELPSVLCEGKEGGAEQCLEIEVSRSLRLNVSRRVYRYESCWQEYHCQESDGFHNLAVRAGEHVEGLYRLVSHPLKPSGLLY
jgi:hypothetical protein